MNSLTLRAATVLAACLHRGRPRPDAGRHPMTRDEQRWYRTWHSHRAAFGDPDAARVATLAVFDIDLLDHRDGVSA